MPSKESKSGDSLALSPMMRALCALFDRVADVQAWIKDCEGYYRFVNRGFLLNYGLESPEQVVGKTDLDLSPPHIAAQFQMDDRYVLEGRGTITGRVELVGRFDHTAVWSVTHKVPLVDEAGAICGTAGITSPLSGRAPETDFQDAAIGRVVGILQQRCEEKWSNVELAREANLSVRVFERRFQKAFHVSPKQYLIRLRTRLAARELVVANKPLSAIANTFGFSDQSHFTREFRCQTGLTPAQYRKQFSG